MRVVQMDASILVFPCCLAVGRGFAEAPGVPRSQRLRSGGDAARAGPLLALSTCGTQSGFFKESVSYIGSLTGPSLPSTFTSFQITSLGLELLPNSELGDIWLILSLLFDRKWEQPPPVWR